MKDQQPIATGAPDPRAILAQQEGIRSTYHDCFNGVVFFPVEKEVLRRSPALVTFYMTQYGRLHNLVNLL